MNIKNILIFLAGAVVGGGAAYFVTKRLVEQKCDQEIQEVRDYYSDPDRKTLKDIKEVDNAETDEEQEDIIEESPKPSSKPDLKKMAAKVRYDQYYGNSGNSDSDSVSKEEDEEVLPDIEIIDENDFRCTNEYEKKALTYFMGDDTLMDDDDGEIIDDIQGCISHEALNRFVEGVVYVRNNKTFTDFEVTEDPRSHEAYIEGDF